MSFYAIQTAFVLGYCSEPMARLIPLADQCICSGYKLQLKCTVIGRGATVWIVDGVMNGMIVLTHNSDFTSQQRARGAIEARGLSVNESDDCYTSLLTISISPDLDGVNITCQHDNGTHFYTIDVYPILLSTGKGTEYEAKLM